MPEGWHVEGLNVKAARWVSAARADELDHLVHHLSRVAVHALCAATCRAQGPRPGPRAGRYALKPPSPVYTPCTVYIHPHRAHISAGRMPSEPCTKTWQDAPLGGIDFDV